jgi:hypothetical protein
MRNYFTFLMPSSRISKPQEKLRLSREKRERPALDNIQLFPFWGGGREAFRLSEIHIHWTKKSPKAPQIRLGLIENRMKPGFQSITFVSIGKLSGF